MNWGNTKTPPILSKRQYFRTRAFLLLLLFFLLLLFILIMDSRAEGEQELEQTYILHYVEAGESLFGIAKKYRPGEDWREVVWEIRQDNGVSPLIHPGQELRVRVKNF